MGTALNSIRIVADMKPIIKSATTGLAQGSAEVISSHDQLEVFHDPNASDPTHSFLAKDHFVSRGT